MPARLIHHGTRDGKKIDRVECECGVVTEFYRWSWAGHGKARCCGCHAWIHYGSLAVQVSNKVIDPMFPNPASPDTRDTKNSAAAHVAKKKRPE